MKKQNQFPLIRVQPAAHKYLIELVAAYKKDGRSRSMTILATDAILAIPMPNHNGHNPPASCGKEEKKPCSD